MGYNTLMRGARWRQLTYLFVAGALAFLAFMALIGSYIVTRGIVNITGEPLVADVVVSTVLSGGLMLTLLVGFTVSLGTLYLAADLDLLLSAPVPRRAVFVSKLLAGMLPTIAVVLALMVVPLIGHGLAMGGYDASYYGAVLLALLLLPVLPSAVGTLAVMHIVRRIPARRLGEVVGLIVVTMTLSIALVAGSARELRTALSLRDLIGLLERFRSPLSPAEWLTTAVTAAARHAYADALGWFLLTAGLTALVVGLVYLGAERLYYEGWIHMQSADQRVHIGDGGLPWNRADRADTLSRPSGWLRWLPVPTQAVVRKDLRVIPRDLTNMSQVLSPLAIGLFFVFQQLVYPIRFGGEATEQLTRPMLFMLSAAIGTGVSAMIMVRFALTALSIEGASYWIIKSSPISRRQLLGAKFVVAYVPYLVLGCGLTVLLELARVTSETLGRGEPLLPAIAGVFGPLLLYAFAVVACVGAGMLALTLALGVVRPNLDWETPHEMLTPDVGCLSLIFYGAYGSLALLALALPAAVSRFGMLEHTGWLWGAGLLVGGGMTAALGYGAYRVAYEELPAVGE